jgi:hypothetical protein
MELANVFAYAVVFGLPIWLVTEEIAHRLGSTREADAALAPAGRGRRTPEGARAHASFV